jgi:transcriptional regulator with XRE-family HTH domain
MADGIGRANVAAMNTSQVQPVGRMLRSWRERRRMSQLDLAGEAEISTRHLSFLETGRSLPSREMVLRLAARLEVPLRERNALLVAAGYAPTFRDRPLDDPALRAARKAIDLLLAGHEPFPALAVDRHWTLLASNRSVPALLAGVEPALLAPPLNVLRVSLHPAGLAPRIANLAQWRSHLLARLRRQVAATGDAVLGALLGELEQYPAPDRSAPSDDQDFAGVVVPLELETPLGRLSFIGTTTMFGTPVDITLSEIAVESFFPADAATAQALERLAPRA